MFLLLLLLIAGQTEKNRCAQAKNVHGKDHRGNPDSLSHAPPTPICEFSNIFWHKYNCSV